MLAFFLTRYGIAALALIFSVIGFQAWKVTYGMKKKEEGRAEVVEKSKVEAKKLNEQVKKATRNITPDNADSQLRKQYSRD